MSDTPAQPTTAEPAAVPEGLERGLGFTETTVTYADGRTEQLHPDSPQIVFLAKRLHLDNLDEEYGDDGLMSGFVMLWLAAGKPGVNGDAGELTTDRLLEHTETWLGTVKTIGRGDPPTNRATRRSRRK